ncbi:hypothetical protein KSP40_PGU022392 [Platanthera guangdongensis]|uniref:Uncharacterized protein n=1 Tax=Platanthera guangdongensis TaxID=2320717 RepID=A0ABR2N4I0_9ASPA
MHGVCRPALIADRDEISRARTDFSRSASTSDRLCSSDNVDLQACKSTDLPLEVFDSHIANASLFIQKMQMEVHGDLARCPYLATIEIERQYRLRGKTDSKLMEALFNYFHRIELNSNYDVRLEDEIDRTEFGIEEAIDREF